VADFRCYGAALRLFARRDLTAPYRTDDLDPVAVCEECVWQLFATQHGPVDRHRKRASCQPFGLEVLLDCLVGGELGIFAVDLYGYHRFFSIPNPADSALAASNELCAPIIAPISATPTAPAAIT